ncbi:hypothetical protein Vadar_000624 [Vaccinium darrowii]|uniref:Uncharacterized protein n=1 Tax=Vaccinium darrowii TaxID=229202 RepID=A0ACB7YSC1_9ERIC|nr:hypothetical protein Vadar_000624 [Vaccinium darrowii]
MDPNNNMTHHQQPPSSTATKLDKAKLAGKGADLLHTASSFGKSKSKSIGKYLGRAENYLRKYHDTHSTTSTPHGGPADTVPLGYPPPTSAPHDYPATNALHGHPATAAHPPIAYPATIAGNDNPYPSQPTGGNGYSGGGHGNSGGGLGDYMKKASGFLKKH